MTPECVIYSSLALICGVGLGLIHGGKWADTKERAGYQRGFALGVDTEMDRLSIYILHPELVHDPARVLRPNDFPPADAL